MAVAALVGRWEVRRGFVDECRVCELVAGSEKMCESAAAELVGGGAERSGGTNAQSTGIGGVATVERAASVLEQVGELNVGHGAP